MTPKQLISPQTEAGLSQHTHLHMRQVPYRVPILHYLSVVITC